MGDLELKYLIEKLVGERLCGEIKPYDSYKGLIILKEIENEK